MRVQRQAGGLQSEVLAALWAADTPLTPGDVVDALGGGLAHTTVQTTLVRLYEMGAVRREKVGRAHAYTPVLDDAGLAARRMRVMLDRGGDRAAVLARFISTLSVDEGAILARLVNGHQN